MNECILKRKLYGHEIEAHITQMPQDIHVLLIGGCLPHIGATSVFEGGKSLYDMELPHHREGIISRRWAEQLSLRYTGKVMVTCGIHYDNATPLMLKEIVAMMEDLLEEVIKKIGTKA